MAQIFHRSANSLSRLSILAVVVVVTVLLCAALEIQRAPYVTYQGVRPGAAGAVQPPAPQCGTGHRLPLLPHVGGAVELRRDSADQDLHELPFADLDERSDAGAGARKLSHRQVAAVDQGELPARLRVLQSQHPREQGRGLLELPWPGEQDAADVPGVVDAHGVVPEMSPRAGEVPAAARPGVQHEL